MSIRRVIDLTNVENVKIRGKDSVLSALLMEASYQHEELFDSVKTTVQLIYDETLDKMQTEHLDKLNVNNLTIDDGNLCIIHSKVRFLSGSSVDAWNNDDPYGEDTYLCCRFDHVNVRSNNEMELSANGQNGIYGNPVVINDNLYVWTNMTQTYNQVSFTNSRNEINSMSFDVSKQTLQRESSSAATCIMLKELAYG